MRYGQRTVADYYRGLRQKALDDAAARQGEGQQQQEQLAEWQRLLDEQQQAKKGE